MNSMHSLSYAWPNRPIAIAHWPSSTMIAKFLIQIINTPRITSNNLSAGTIIIRLWFLASTISRFKRISNSRWLLIHYEITSHSRNLWLADTSVVGDELGIQRHHSTGHVLLHWLLFRLFEMVGCAWSFEVWLILCWLDALQLVCGSVSGADGLLSGAYSWCLEFLIDFIDYWNVLRVLIVGLHVLSFSNKASGSWSCYRFTQSSKLQRSELRLRALHPAKSWKLCWSWLVIRQLLVMSAIFYNSMSFSFLQVFKWYALVLF